LDRFSLAAVDEPKSDRLLVHAAVRATNLRYCLVRWRAGDKPRKPGRFQGQIRMAPDFDALPPGVLDEFEGR